MPRWVMPRCDGEADLVVKLRRGRYVAFLLNMKSHAGGTGRNAATIRSELLGDNWVCVLRVCKNFQLLYVLLCWACKLPLCCRRVRGCKAGVGATALCPKSCTNRFNYVLAWMFWTLIWVFSLTAWLSWVVRGWRFPQPPASLLRAVGLWIFCFLQNGGVINMPPSRQSPWVTLL